jgi:hypothetical protein
LIGAALVVSEIWIDIIGFVEVSEMAECFLNITDGYVSSYSRTHKNEIA